MPEAFDTLLSSKLDASGIDGQPHDDWHDHEPISMSPLNHKRHLVLVMLGKHDAGFAEQA